MKRALLVTLLAACADRGLTDDPRRDDEAPVLEVTEPARGAILDDGAMVTVRGTVRDSGTVNVAVNDRAAQVDADGRFTIQVPAPAGLTLLHTVATDAAGNMDSDTRAVLGGNLVPLATPVEHALTAQISAGAFRLVGAIGAAVIDGIDLQDTVAGLNPIVDVSLPCLAARVDVVEAHKGAAHIDLQPETGALALDADVADVEVKLHVTYTAFCSDGEADVTVTADRFRLGGVLTVDLPPTGGVRVGVNDSNARFEGFQVEQDVLPQVVVDLLQAPVGAVLATAVAGEVEGRVPPLLEEVFADLAHSEPFSIDGTNVHFGLWLTAVDITADGAQVALDTNVYVDAVGGTGLMYLANPRPAPSWADMPQAEGAFRVALADDAANQLFASLWAGGLLDRSFGAEGATSAALFDRVDITLTLPPVVSALPAGGGLRIALGDVLCTFLKNGAVVTKLAVSGEAVLLAELTADSHLRVTSRSPQVWLDLLADRVEGQTPLARGQVEELGSFVARNLIGVATGLVEKVPIPSVPGTRFSGAVSTGERDGGYVLVTGKLE